MLRKIYMGRWECVVLIVLLKLSFFLAVNQNFQRKSSALNTDSHFCNYPLLRLETCVFHEHLMVLLLRIAFFALIITAPETE
jgi:hypothetical protein